jgi:hypothetical protein
LKVRIVFPQVKELPKTREEAWNGFLEKRGTENLGILASKTVRIKLPAVKAT